MSLFDGQIALGSGDSRMFGRSCLGGRWSVWLLKGYSGMLMTFARCRYMNLLHLSNVPFVLLLCLVHPAYLSVELAPPRFVNMGFLKACIDTLLSLATFNGFSPYDISSQKPFISSSDVVPVTASDFNSFEPINASPGFQCVYPKRWKSCNTASSRDCWLQDTESADEFGSYSQVDIHTDCQSSQMLDHVKECN